MSRVIVVGSGFSGLVSAAMLRKKGHDVLLLEKNDHLGGRAGIFSSEGFTFDMGPSWYWMPEVFETYYNIFNHTTSDFYQLDRLDPSYRVYFGPNDFMDMPADYNELKDIFESIESGAGKKLDEFLASAQYKYEVGMKEFVYKPSLSVFEFMDIRLLRSALKLKMFSSLSDEVRALFKNEKLIKILEFPVLFLGAKPDNIPALYSLMNYADIKLGTWYPQGGMYEVVKAFAKIARDQGVDIKKGEEVLSVNLDGNEIHEVITTQAAYACDAVVAACDYHHFETSVIPPTRRSYGEEYWDSRVMAPSSLIYFLGLNRKLEGINHHTLFFDKDFEDHAREIYDEPQWPSDPLFYICTPSVSDVSVAPEGCENLFLLMPLAPGVEDTEELREKYLKLIIQRIHEVMGEDISDVIVYKRSYAIRDFKEDYNSFKGNAYGLANTLKQTAFLKPKMRSKKITNLFYTGQLTTPGPGVPPSIISGQVVSSLVDNQVTRNHENTIR